MKLYITLKGSSLYSTSYNKIVLNNNFLNSGLVDDTNILDLERAKIFLEKNLKDMKCKVIPMRIIVNTLNMYYSLKNNPNVLLYDLVENFGYEKYNVFVSTTMIGSILDSLYYSSNSAAVNTQKINNVYKESNRIMNGKYNIIGGFIAGYNCSSVPPLVTLELDMDFSNSDYLLDARFNFKLLEIFKDYSNGGKKFKSNKNFGLYFPYIKSNFLYNSNAKKYKFTNIEKTIYGKNGEIDKKSDVPFILNDNFNNCIKSIKIYDLTKCNFLNQFKFLNSKINKLEKNKNYFDNKKIKNKEPRHCWIDPVSQFNSEGTDIYDEFDFSEISKYSLNNLKEIDKKYINIYNVYTTRCNKKIKRLKESLGTYNGSLLNDSKYSLESCKYLFDLCNKYDIPENEKENMLVLNTNVEECLKEFKNLHGSNVTIDF